MYRFSIFAALLAFVMVTVTGCLSPPPRLYLLEPVVDEKSQRTPTEVQRIGLPVITLPEYADTQSIPTRVDSGRVVLSQHHQWAESPDVAITRVLANRIEAYTGGTALVEPWPRGFETQARIEYDLLKLLRDETGGVEVAGQMRLISGDGDDVIAIESFQFFRESVESESDDFFYTLSLIINDIARLTIVELQAMEVPN